MGAALEVKCGILDDIFDNRFIVSIYRIMKTNSENLKQRYYFTLQCCPGKILTKNT